MNDTFLMGTTSSITMQRLVKFEDRTMRAGCRCENMVFVTGRMPRSGKLPVLNLLTGQKSGFSPRRGDSLHRVTSNLAGPTGTSAWLCKISPQSPQEVGNAAPKIAKISTFW